MTQVKYISAGQEITQIYDQINNANVTNGESSTCD